MSENFEKYKETINRIYRETKDEQWTMPVATLVLLLGGILLMTILVNVVFFSFPHWFIVFFVYLIEILAPLFVLYRYQQNVYHKMREKISELDAAQPGIMNAFEKWHKKVAPPE